MSKQNVIDYYRRNWPLFVKSWQVDKTHCIHYGYYDKGVHSHIASVLNMNDFIAQLLGLNSKSEETKHILDAGCGIGGTIVYLSKKYPNIKFTGITIVPEHVQMANRFAAENMVDTNTKFLIKDYLDTGFSSNSFDAVFSIESINYTTKRKDFLNEMHRILKSNGKLVVIDAFRTDIRLNPFLKNLHFWYCKGMAFPSITYIEEFKSFLKNKGFREIIDITLTRNVLPSVIRGNFISIPYLLSTLTKKIIRGKKYRTSDDPTFPASVSIFPTIIGLKKGVTYNAITAIKK